MKLTTQNSQYSQVHYPVLQQTQKEAYFIDWLNDIMAKATRSGFLSVFVSSNVTKPTHSPSPNNNLQTSKQSRMRSLGLIGASKSDT